MTTQSPDPFPTGGLRGLSPREAMQRVAALACTLPKDNAPACTGQVNVGIFFDGTGNNRDEDYLGIAASEQIKAMRSGTAPLAPASFPDGLRKHTNIVRLFHAHRDEPKAGFFRYYIPGVGTPFAEIGDEGGTRGSAMGAGGEERILWAFTRLLNATYDYVLKGFLLNDDESKALVDKLSSRLSHAWQRRDDLKIWQAKLEAALKGKKPRIVQINLSVFGFSRGAAQARAFTNWLFEVCDQRDGGWLFAGIPLRVSFLGIFDTVASVGLADVSGNGVLEGHQKWADDTMEIHPAIEQCVHYVAGHEVRACFPLDSVRVRKTYPPNAKEVMFPGSHSDVGGGYAPGDLGVSPTSDMLMSTIAGANMYWEAYLAGVPLRTWNELAENDQNDLTPSDKLITDFNSYLKAADIGHGPVEEMHRRHMALYHSYRFKYRMTYRDLPWYQSASEQDKRYLDKTSINLLERLVALRYRVPVSDSSYDPRAAKQSYTDIIGPPPHVPMQQLHQVVDSIDVKQLSAPIERLFDRYVHDSMAGFIGFGMNEYAINNMGIVKFRTIFDRNG
jgi:hypothetical protein